MHVKKNPFEKQYLYFKLQPQELQKTVLKSVINSLLQDLKRLGVEY